MCEGAAQGNRRTPEGSRCQSNGPLRRCRKGHLTGSVALEDLREATGLPRASGWSR
ncbi:hypothetical protein ACFPRL_14650 [Pseudoclavibacter helvolus]